MCHNEPIAVGNHQRMLALSILQRNSFPNVFVLCTVKLEVLRICRYRSEVLFVFFLVEVT